MFRNTIAAFLLFAGLASASNPTLAGISPRGAQRGTEAKLLFNGANLADAKELFKYTDKFEVLKFQVVNPNQVAVTVKIPEDCSLGEHAFRVRCDSGVTELRTFWVGPFPIVEEKEPNNDFATAQPLSMNVTVHGTITNEDVDYFVVELKKGQRLSLEIEAVRLGTIMFDSYIAVLNEKRFEIAASDDTPLFAQDGYLSLLAPADGKYYIQVRESSYRGNAGDNYRLHVGDFPRPRGVIPAGGKPGEELEVTFIGDAAGPAKRRIKVPAAAVDGKAMIYMQDSTAAPSGVPFRVSSLDNFIEAEPNDTLAEATKVSVPGAFNGIIDKPGDVDMFKFTAKKGETFDFRVYARKMGSALDAVLELVNAKGGRVAFNDDSGGPDSFFRATIPADGEYILTIKDHLKKGGPDYFYRIEVKAPQASTEVTTVKPVQYSQERQAFAVPRGNRFAVLMSATRQDWGGDLNINLKGLPEGVAYETDTMAGNMAQVPVVLTADEDADLEGTLLDVEARPADAKLNLPWSFHQSPELILGNPNQTIYWTYRAPRAALAVTKEVPFTIEIVEPKAPLVQNGAMNLKIVAKRKEGFKAAITIVPLYNPPGVGTVPSVVIPEGQNEVFLPMNANGGAPVRKWKYVVQGQAVVDGGPVWVSSQLANIEIAPPYLTLGIERGVIEQGKEAKMFVKLTPQRPFEGKAVAKLMNLPPKSAAKDQEFDKDAKEIAFPVVAEAATPVGTHKNIFCQVTLKVNGEDVIQNIGGSELRVDAPAAAKPGAVAGAKPAAQAADGKRLTRLEQLRLEQEEREKAEKKKN